MLMHLYGQHIPHMSVYKIVTAFLSHFIHFILYVDVFHMEMQYICTYVTLCIFMCTDDFKLCKEVLLLQKLNCDTATALKFLKVAG